VVVEALEVRGTRVPKIGLGTWNMTGPGAVDAVASALALGYRHIDTAEMYRNESEIGQALQQAGVPREELYLVSKVWPDHLTRQAVVEACGASLARLGTDYLDLYLIHWPSDRVPIEETMAGLNQLVEDGRTRQIGVSNFSLEQLRAAQAASSAPVFCNQVKFHLDHPQANLVAYSQQHELLITAYTPLAKGRFGHKQTLVEIAGRTGKTSHQVALRWLIQQPNVVAIPKASQRQHQLENLGIFDFELSEDEMDGLSRG